MTRPHTPCQRRGVEASARSHFFVTFVRSAVCPCVGAVAVNVIILEFSLILRPVRPEEFTLSLLFAFSGAQSRRVRHEALKKAAPRPQQSGNMQRSVVLAARRVEWRQTTAPRKLTSNILSLILGAVRPYFFSESFLLVILPLADVFGSVSVGVGTLAVGLVVLPLALVHVCVAVNQTTAAVGHVVEPVALIHTSVLPNLLASAFFFLKKRGEDE